MIKSRLTYLYIIFVIFAIVSALSGIDATFLLTLAVWLLALFYSLANLKTRSLLAAFLVAFFVFLMGGHLVYEYFGLEVFYFISEDHYYHSNLCMLVSLVALLFGAWLKSTSFSLRHSFRPRTVDPDTNFLANLTENKKIMLIRKYSLLFYYATCPFWFYTVLSVVQFVLANSYYEYYTEYESPAPFVVKAIAAMTPYFFFLFLATLPSKKECKWPILLYLSFALLSLFTGRRINIVVMVLVVVIYLIFRQNIKGEKETWIKRNHVITVVILAPLLMVGLQIWNFVRIDSDIENASFAEMFFGFLQQQGFSSSLIRLEMFYENQLRDDAYYSFFGIVKFFRTNTLFRFLFPQDYGFSYVGNSEQFALEGNSLSNTLGYYVLRGYLNGNGLGTCYIAELYHDFRFYGVVLGNVVYGYLLITIGNLWNRTKNYSVLVTAIGFGLVESFLKAPRWNFDIFISYFLDMGMWMSFIIVYGTVSLLKNKL